jgi:DegV family protein with EDD domain
MKVIISADSSCDLTPQILADYNISIVPVTVIVGEQTFTDGEDIRPDDIFKYVENEGKTCRTAAINIHQYYTYFKKLTVQQAAVIHISLGSGFSSCYQNAVLAAQELPGVYIIDSKNLSSGAGQLVLEAALMAKGGLEPEEICQQLNELADKVEGSFVIDRLDYLHRGGRCSALESEGSRLLKIKPCIEVVGGKMIVGKKFRGSFEKVMRRFIAAKLAERNDIDFERIFIAHAACSPSTIELVKTEISKYAGFKEIVVAEAGTTVAAHCGPNTLGIFYLRL